MNTDPIDIVKKYLAEVRRLGINIDRAYLFGSYAKGKVWEGSDMDICVISDNFGKDYMKEKMLLNKAALKIDSRIEPVAYSPDDFENKYDSLVDEVKRFGIIVHQLTSPMSKKIEVQFDDTFSSFPEALATTKSQVETVAS